MSLEEENDASDTDCQNDFEEVQNEGPTFLQADLSLPAVSVLLHDYCGHVDNSSISDPKHCVASCQTDLKSTLIQDAATQSEVYR